MRIVDANLLLYASSDDFDHHEASRTWLDHALSGGDTVGLAWIAVLAFVRISTKIGLFPNPLSAGDALTQVEDWLGAPGAQLVAPTSGHLRVLTGLLTAIGAGRNLVNDAHLAALAVEHRAGVVSYDADFGRFAGVRWERPDDLLR